MPGFAITCVPPGISTARLVLKVDYQLELPRMQFHAVPLTCYKDCLQVLFQVRLVDADKQCIVGIHQIRKVSFSVLVRSAGT